MRSELACDPTFWTLPQVGEWVRCTIKEGAVVNTDMSFLSDQLFPLVWKYQHKCTSLNLSQVVRVRKAPSRQELNAFCSRMWQKNPPFFVFPCLRNGRRDLNLKKNVFPRVHNLNFRRRAFFGRKIAATRLISLEFFEPSVTQSSPIDPCDGWCDRI